MDASTGCRDVYFRSFDSPTACNADTRVVIVLGHVLGGIAAVLAGAVKNSLGLSAAFQIAGAILCLSGLLLLRIRVVPVPGPAETLG